MSVGYMAKCSSRGKPKKQHTTQASAEEQRRGLIKAGIWRADRTNTYFCNQCGHWHAGRLGRSNRGKGKRTAKNTPRHLASQ